MKKILLSISLPIVLTSLLSCANENNLTNNINPIGNNQTQTFAAKSEFDNLVQKMIDKRFTFADKDKDKKLIFAEYKRLESEPEDIMKMRFDSVDKNKDSIVSYDEFVTDESRSSNGFLKLMFEMLDKDKSAYIDQETEIDMVVEIGYITAKSSDPKLTRADVRNFHLSYDTNKDKKLNFTEYQVPAMTYIVMASVDPYKNSFKGSVNLISFSSIVNNLKNLLKK